MHPMDTQVKKWYSGPTSLDFNHMSICLGLFYAWRLENCVHFKLIFTFICVVF